jgi:hypothetical protein
MENEKREDSQPKQDPRIQSLVRKIEALFKEYDVGGFVNIISEKGGDIALMMPDWGGVKILGMKSGQIQFQVAISMNAPEKASRTLHFIECFRNTAALLLANGDQIFAALESEGARIVVSEPHKN